MTNFIALAKKVIDIEANGILQLKNQLNDAFSKACEKMLACKGKVVVLGIGKSSYIGAKIAASLASTGTPAFFVHAAEASHGDLGMIDKEDMVIAISNSGETAELVKIIPLIKHAGIPLIAIGGNPRSSLGLAADIFLNVNVPEEACPLGLAPTTSTTAALVMGDALAVSLLQARGFTPADFARTHPGGSLGKRLLLKVADLMHTGAELPLMAANMRLSEALIQISQKGFGIGIITNQKNQMEGIFTDGDLRRTLDRHVDLRDVTIQEVMTRGGKHVKMEALATEALALMEKYKITVLPVLSDDQHVVGLIHMHDLLRAGVN